MSPGSSAARQASCFRPPAPAHGRLLCRRPKSETPPPFVGAGIPGMSAETMRRLGFVSAQTQKGEHCTTG